MTRAEPEVAGIQILCRELCRVLCRTASRGGAARQSPGFSRKHARAFRPGYWIEVPVYGAEAPGRLPPEGGTPARMSCGHPVAAVTRVKHLSPTLRRTLTRLHLTAYT